MITLGLVDSVDGNGTYVTMPGSRGVVRGPFATLQNVVAGDRVLVVTTDDGESVVVGLAAASVPGVSIPDGSITSAKIANGTIVNEDVSGSAAIDRSKISGLPTTSTDNAVARFDGTTGALQNSGVTIDDSGSIATPATVYVQRNGLSLDLQATDATNSWCGLRLSRGLTRRWEIQKSDYPAETGSGNTGSDLQIARYADNGDFLGRITYWRNTGKLTLDGVGSGAGIEMGSSGPRMMAGASDPSGVDAPVGSTWRQTDANSTHGSLTGLLWNKVGTGTTEGTDWLVDYEGRWIDWTPTLTNITRGTGYSQRNKFTRQGKTVTFDFALHFGTSGAVSAEPSITLPITPVATQEHSFPALLRTTSTYSLGIGYYYSTSAMTFFALGVAGTYVGDIASVTGLAGSWANTGRIQVTGTYEIA